MRYKKTNSPLPQPILIEHFDTKNARERFGIRGDACMVLEKKLVPIYHTVTEKERNTLRTGLSDAEFCKFVVRKMEEHQNFQRY